MKRLILIVSLLVPCLLAAQERADTTALGTVLRREAPAGRERINIMIIGNSYTVDAANQNLCELLDAAGFDARVGSLYIGGCTLERHWRTVADTTEHKRYDYYRITAAGSEKIPGATIADALRDGPWDWVVFQQGSGLNGIYESHFPWLHYLEGYVQAFLEPASYRTAYQQSWAFHRSCTRKAFVHYGFDHDRMLSMVVDAARRLRSEVDVVIPSFAAVENGRATYLGDTFHRDNTSHLEKTYGRFTVACTWFEALTGLNVVLNPYRPEGMSEELAALCRECAHRAVINPFEVEQ